MMNRKSILIVDENEDFLSSSIEFLTLDMKVDVVTWAVSVEEAADKVEKYNPEIIILDLATPQYNGKDFPIWLKGYRRNSKVVVTSFFDNPDYRFLASEAGADVFIAKNDFKASIVELLNKLSFNLRFDEFILPLN